MSQAPERGPNGQDSEKAVRAAAIAKAEPSPLALPAASTFTPTLARAQRSKFPFLEAFAARGKIRDDGKAMEHYEVRFGIRLGLATGRDMTLTIPVGMQARALAELLDKTSASLKAWADDCDQAGTDPRDQAAAPGAQKGDALLPAAPAVAVASALAPAGGPCPGATWYAGGSDYSPGTALCTRCNKPAREHLASLIQPAS